MFEFGGIAQTILKFYVSEKVFDAFLRLEEKNYIDYKRRIFEKFLISILHDPKGHFLFRDEGRETEN